jgi:hypothetical protein
MHSPEGDGAEERQEAIFCVLFWQSEKFVKLNRWIVRHPELVEGSVWLLM